MSQQQTFQEKRLKPRLPVVFSLEYETNSGWAPLGETFDISEGGIGINLKVPINPASRLRWRSATDPIQALGRVAWLDSAHHRCGVQFVEIDASTKNKIEQHLLLNQEIFNERLSRFKNLSFSVKEFFKSDLFQSLCSINKILKSVTNKTEREIEGEIKLLLDDLVEKVDRKSMSLSSKFEKMEMGNAFRQLVGPWIYQSLIMKRATDKPRGYPGDYAMIESIYDYKEISPFEGKYFDYYFLQNPYAIAVKNRKEAMKETLLKIAESAQTELKVLNIACGSCREVKEYLLAQRGHNNPLRFTCVDHDEEALEFARKNLQQEKAISFVQESVLNFARNPEIYSRKFEKYDVIYSIGLADYLPDKILKALIKFLFGLLKTGGTLIVAHKDIDQYKPLPPNWYCDWHFVSRNEEQFVSLIKETIPDSNEIIIRREKSQIIFFLTINNLLKKRILINQYPSALKITQGVMFT